MSQYRDDLAAAQARIAELEGDRDRAASSPDLDALEREHAALVRAVPSRARAWLSTGISAFVSLVTLVSMLFLASPYDHSPRFTIAVQMVVIFSTLLVAAIMWMSRAHGLEKVALAQRLLAAERERAALASRVRVADATRIPRDEEIEAEDESGAEVKTTPPRRA